MIGVRGAAMPDCFRRGLLKEYVVDRRWVADGNGVGVVYE